MRTADDLREVFEMHQQSGADIAEPTQDCSWGMREMVVNEPDGNTFRIGCQIEERSEAN